MVGIKKTKWNQVNPTGTPIMVQLFHM